MWNIFNWYKSYKKMCKFIGRKSPNENQETLINLNRCLFEIQCRTKILDGLKCNIFVL